MEADDVPLSSERLNYLISEREYTKALDLCVSSEVEVNFCLFLICSKFFLKQNLYCIDRLNQILVLMMSNRIMQHSILSICACIFYLHNMMLFAIYSIVCRRH